MIALWVALALLVIVAFSIALGGSHRAPAPAMIERLRQLVDAILFGPEPHWSDTSIFLRSRD